ncbi:MAG: SusD/RagB family nutrient-binding outer membrane lipoprotein [Bacteroidales bacterium]|jgi:hypothetical protein|nr:SusD/RagB family nutrient-binding outer membrane lipoprotein [Bacteroidales bacterium]
MIKKNIYKIILAFALVFSLSACEQWIDPEINDDPDRPLDVDMSLLLSGIQLDMAYTLGGIDISANTSIWMQYVKGTDRQFSAIDVYNLRTGDLNNAWESMYAGFMKDIYIMRTKAEATAPVSNHYVGVSKVLMAYSIGTATSIWGDVPYTEAFLEDKNLTPKFDSQEDIYNTINTLLTEAIADFGKDAGLFNISGDLVYGGKTDSWIKLAHTLRARYAMHLTKKGTVNYANVIADIDAGISSNDENYTFQFDATEAAAGPLYQFRTQRDGYANVNQGFEALVATDIRKPVLVDIVFGGFYSNRNSKINHVTYSEAQFIKAEAQVRNSGNGDAAYNEALKASVEYYFNLGYLGVLTNEDDELAYDLATMPSAAAQTTWITANSKTNATVQEIIEGKYVHMFMHTEAFVDYRRTGFPVLTPTTGSQLPARFPYAGDEINYNSNCPKGVTVFDKLWAFQ